MKKLLLASLLLALPHISWGQLVPFVITLDGVQSGTASLGTGSAFGTIDRDNNIFTLTFSFSGLGTPATAAHIHRGAPGVNGPVIIGAPSFPLAGPQPFFFQGSISEAVELDLLNNNTYLNIHSQQFPAGEIRGQLLIAVPEPSTYAATGVAILAGAIYLRRRRQTCVAKPLAA